MTDPDAPAVSVVIPTYMRAAAVARALDSIDEPDLGARLQVIVVDNASTDDTEQVVRARLGALPGLEYHRWPENLGPVENWRRGVARAQAPWLKILWSDDALTRGAISRMLFAAQRYSASVVTCQAVIEYPDGRTVVRYLDRPTTLTPDIVTSELLHFPAGLPSSPGAALVRRDDAAASLEQPLPEVCLRRAIGPDLLMTYWGVFHGGLGVHLPDPLARFAAGADSITVRTPRAVLSSCYGAALGTLVRAADESASAPSVSRTTMRRLRSRAALDGILGGEADALLSPRRLSVRATGYDSYQLVRHWWATHVMRRRGI
jgi:hypothetical protein